MANIKQRLPLVPGRLRPDEEDAHAHAAGKDGNAADRENSDEGKALPNPHMQSQKARDGEDDDDQVGGEINTGLGPPEGPRIEAFGDVDPAKLLEEYIDGPRI